VSARAEEHQRMRAFVHEAGRLLDYLAVTKSTCVCEVCDFESPAEHHWHDCPVVAMQAALEAL